MTMPPGPADGESAAIGADLRLAPERVRERCLSIGDPLHLLATTTSTNDEARRAAKEGASGGATWVAEQQTSGRGRRGRAWLSPPGEGLLFSVLIRTTCLPTRLPPIALLAGLAVREAVVQACPTAEAALKWPNDVLIGGRKVAGVLVEAITIGMQVEAVVVGIGINVHTRAFPEAIAGRATSLALCSPEMHPDRACVLADVLTAFDRDFQAVVRSGLAPLRARLDGADGLRGLRVRSDAGDAGMASGIDNDGRLLVRLDDGGLARWGAGEVHIVPRSDPEAESLR